MGKINSRRKGKTGELELSKKFTELFGIPCRRGVQYSGIGGADVVGVAALHIEVKRTEKPNIHKAYSQAVADAKDGEIPVVCHRRSHEPWMITMALSDVVFFQRVIDDARKKELEG